MAQSRTLTRTRRRSSTRAVQSTRSTPARAAGSGPLTGPREREGTCPACHGVWAVNDLGQTPEHTRADRSQPRRCPCSGWLAKDIHDRPYMYVEGVMWL